VVPHVLIAGVSARAAAESAADAGFEVTAIDAFGDLDQHRAVRSISIPRRFTTRAVARIARGIECDAVAYLSNFENDPDAVSTIAAGRALWENAPSVLRKVRDPVVLTRVLRRRGCAAPDVVVPEVMHAVRLKADTTTTPSVRLKADTTTTPSVRLKADTTHADRRWLSKPLASGGGHRVQSWDADTALPEGCYLQQFVDGTPGSVVFVAAGGNAVVMGVSRQLVGDAAFGADGFRYCGSILLSAGNGALVDAARGLAGVVTEEFGLVGVNGIDFIMRDGVVYAVEVNPRWCASMELVERACGLSVFGAHAAACGAGALPDFDLVRASHGAGAVGKAIVFADRDVEVGNTRAWIGDPSVRDLPQPHRKIRAGRPVCTVFAAGSDDVECHAALADRAAQVYVELKSCPV
jgi:uncharacterized protein